MSQPEQEPGIIEIEEVPQAGGASAAPSVQQVARTLVRGAAIYAVANFGIRALNFLLLPVYTRFLTPADYGVISLAETLALVVSIFSGLGLEGGISRLYYQYVDRPQELRDFLTSVLRFGAWNSAGVVALSLLAGPLLLKLVAPRFDVPFFPYIALAVATVACAQIVNYRLALYQAETRPNQYALLAAGFFVMTATGSLALVVGKRGGAEGMLAGKLAAAIIAAATAFILMRRWLGGRFGWRHVREILTLSTPLLPHQFMALGLVAADRFIVARYRNLEEVGIYSLAYTFGMVMAVVTMSLTQAWSPLYFDVNRQGAPGRQIVARIGSGLAIGLIAVAIFGSVIAQDFVAVVLDARYRAVGPLIPWIIGGYLMHAMFSLLHLALFQVKRTALLWQVSFVAFAANIALNLLLVPRWGMYGAAYATTAGYAVEALIIYFYAQRVFPLPFRTAKVLAGLAVFAAVVGVTQVRWQMAHVLVMVATLAISWGVLGAISRDELQAAWRTLWVQRGAANTPS
ncbi:MAG: lipopolysaccharide biosynthesis protein [Acidobacteriia bacterium]|nr:lipopolysaccharide biosynthesis protein [Terriglobia bacterium]